MESVRPDRHRGARKIHLPPSLHHTDSAKDGVIPGPLPWLLANHRSGCSTARGQCRPRRRDVTMESAILKAAKQLKSARKALLAEDILAAPEAASDAPATLTGSGTS